MRNNVGTTATFKLNGTNPLPAIVGTVQQIRTAVRTPPFHFWRVY
jgi:hypothetical protein